MGLGRTSYNKNRVNKYRKLNKLPSLDEEFRLKIDSIGRHHSYGMAYPKVMDRILERLLKDF